MNKPIGGYYINNVGNCNDYLSITSLVVWLGIVIKLRNPRQAYCMSIVIVLSFMFECVNEQLHDLLTNFSNKKHIILSKHRTFIVLQVSISC